MTDFIEIRQGGPDIPDAVYPMVLTAIAGEPDNPSLPRHVVPTQGPNIGKDLYFWDWKFVIDLPGHVAHEVELEYGTSTATGPKSKMLALLTALFNGARPPVGTKISREQLIGRMVLGTVQRDESGYVRIVSFSAMPTQVQQQHFVAATGAPVAQPPQAVAPQAIPQPAQVPQQVPAVAQPGYQAPVGQVVPPQPPQAVAQGQPAAVPVGAAQGDQLPF